MKSFQVKKIVRGNCRGEILLFPAAFSFLGDIDLENGEILVDVADCKGKSIAGKILVFKESKGSSGGALVLQTLKNIGKAPLGLVCTSDPDFNLVEGAILCQLPYAAGIDFQIFHEAQSGMMADLDLENQQLNIY